MSLDDEYLKQIPEAINLTDYYLAILLCERATPEDIKAWMNTRFYLGWLHEFGLGVEQNYEMAIAFYLDAANYGHYIAKFRIGAISARLRNFEKAVYWFQQAADEGYAPAMWRLGVYYRGGRYLPKNIDMANKLFKDAMKLGHAPAMSSYGSILLGDFNPCGLYYKIKGLIVFFSSGLDNPKIVVD